MKEKIKMWEVKIGRLVYVSVGEKPQIREIDNKTRRGIKADVCMVDEVISESELFNLLIKPQ